MKGKLTKDNANKWFVKEVKTIKNCFGCKTYDVINVYELHPEDSIYCLDSDEGKEVTFEIVEENIARFIKSGILMDSLTVANTPPNSFIFSLKNDEPIIVIDEVGFKYKGELIEDSGEVYKLFKQFLIDVGK